MTEVNEVNFSKGGKMAEGEGAKRWAGLIRMIVTGGVVILALAIVAGGLYWFFFVHSAEQKAAKAGGKEGGQTAEAGPELIENPLYLDLGSFTVNLAEGRRYLKISMELLVSDQKADDYLKTRLLEAKDLVVAELQQQTADSLSNPRERELLKQRILTKLQTLLPLPPKEWKDPMPIKKLLITEFLIQ